MNKQKEEKNIADIFNESGAVIWISTYDGGANVTLCKDGRHTVKFVDEEGYASEDMELDSNDILKVANFIDKLNSLKLSDYKV